MIDMALACCGNYIIVEICNSSNSILKDFFLQHLCFNYYTCRRLLKVGGYRLLPPILGVNEVTRKI